MIMPDNVRLTCTCGSIRFRVVIQAGTSYMECQEEGCGRWYHRDNGWRHVPAGAVVYVNPDHWKSMDYGYTEEKKMEKKPKKWPTVIASAVVALGIGTGALMLNAKDTLTLPLPVYADIRAMIAIIVELAM